MLTRREYLTLMCAAAGAAALPSAASAQASPHGGWTGGWPLWMSRAGEIYAFDARTPQGYEVARYLLRDIRGGGVRGNPNPWLLRSLSTMQMWWAQMGYHVPLDATSGLRLHSTNARIEGAARGSHHLPDRFGYFHAIDFVPRGVDLVPAARWARASGVGGLGIYLDRDFLHVDAGRQRQWVKR